MTIRQRIWLTLTILWGGALLLLLFGSIYFVMWFLFAPFMTSTP